MTRRNTFDIFEESREEAGVASNGEAQLLSKKKRKKKKDIKNSSHEPQEQAASGSISPVFDSNGQVIHHRHSKLPDTCHGKAISTCVCVYISKELLGTTLLITGGVLVHPTRSDKNKSWCSLVAMQNRLSPQQALNLSGIASEIRPEKMEACIVRPRAI